MQPRASEQGSIRGHVEVDGEMWTAGGTKSEKRVDAIQDKDSSTVLRLEEFNQCITQERHGGSLKCIQQRSTHHFLGPNKSGHLE